MQRKYALDIVAETGMLGSKPFSTPIELNQKLLSDKSLKCKDPVQFRRFIGRLVHFMITRPDICYAVHVLSQVMHDPREAHWEPALRIVQYIKRCRGQGILLKAKSDFRIRTYCDSDYNSCPRTRCSLSVVVVNLGESPVSWKTKKQDTVSHSSAEAEYRAMAAALQELKWIKQLIADLGVVQIEPMELYFYSNLAIYIAANSVFHERTKHIESDCHSVRHAVRDKLIVTPHIRTTEQFADVLTKALGTSRFNYLVAKLGMCDVHAPT
ncbi:Retrovirus-related Pol polyprotein from transposon RE2 [Cardamine amara subsp. amara]|uniref:Retrovirus-related Pol polyprotein from transposon RE2 n=1 Tax=Cardamine amara subsp. amara TaxID=228776 RepID=A0ABD0ZYH6_CARAN